MCPKFGSAYCDTSLMNLKVGRKMDFIWCIREEENMEQIKIGQYGKARAKAFQLNAKKKIATSLIMFSCESQLYHDAENCLFIPS